MTRKTTPGPALATITPAIAGPSARVLFIAMPLRVMAAVSCSRGTRSGISAEKAGIIMAAPIPIPKVRPSRPVAVIALARVMAPSSVATPIIHAITISRYTRRSTMSANAPAGTARKNPGNTVAVGTSDTRKGSGARLVMSQPAPTSCIQVPSVDITAAIHRARNTGNCMGAKACPNAERGFTVISGSVSDVDMGVGVKTVWAAVLKWLC